MSSALDGEREKIRREAREAIERAKREVAERASTALPNDQTGDASLVEGSVEVVVVPPVTSALRAKLEESLAGIARLRLVTAGGSTGSGIRMIVFAERPLPLAAELRQLPFVAQVTAQPGKKAARLQVKLAVSSPPDEQ